MNIRLALSEHGQTRIDEIDAEVGRLVDTLRALTAERTAIALHLLVSDATSKIEVDAAMLTGAA